MRKKCENCGEEFEAKRADAKYCSAKCRVAANRNNVTDNSVTDNVTDKEYRGRATGKTLKEMGAQDLYDEIESYPGDTWWDSAEYKELMKRLNGKSLEELRRDGYKIPNWKKPGLKR